MTITAEPTTATTSSGALLPLVALPQGELLSINEQSIPLLTDSLSAGVHVKPLRLDLEAGCWVVLATFSPGATVPLHYHTGIAEVYTMAGSWHYLEYPDQPQTAGSYMYEPAGSVHTFVCPETNTEDTVLFIRVEGANINFTEDGQFHSILDTTMIRHLVDQLARERGLGALNYLGGGPTGFTAPSN